MQPERPILFSLAILAVTAACQDDPTEHPPARPAAPSSAYVQVLGTVQDGGLPHAACRCAHCTAARDQPGRARRVAALAIRLPESGRVFLVDATPDIRPQLEDVGPETVSDGVDRSPVDGVLLTHAHLGHYTGLAFFGYEAVHTSDIPVFGSPAMAAFLRANQPWRQLVDIGNIRIVEIRPGETFELGEGVSVTPLAVPHRDELSDTLGFEIRGPARRLLYVPDTDRWESWDPPIERRVADVDVALLDGTFFSADELPGRDHASIGHPLITDSMQRLEPIVRRGETAVYFTHLNHSNPALDPTGTARAQIEQRGFRVLDEGQRFPL
jgi:pyrroloquinoline quinone biosynthesis protein B